MIKSFFKALGYFLAFAALCAVAGYFIYQTVNYDKTGEVPDLAAKSLTEASELLNMWKELNSQMTDPNWTPRRN